MTPDYSHTTSLYESLAPDQLVHLCEFARVTAGSSDPESVQQAVTSAAVTLLGASYSSIQILDEQLVVTMTLRRQSGNLSEEVARRIDQVTAGWVIHNRDALNCPDLASDSRFPYLAGLDECRRAILAVPVNCENEMVGVLILSRACNHPFDRREETIATIVASIAASALQTGRRLRLMQEANEILRSRLAREEGLRPLIGRSDGWRHACEVIRNVAPTDARLLILGESGTGKEICARSTHLLSARRDRPFVAVNCAAMPESLAESEFFGHVKGAFTGAVRDYNGLFAEADGGTLFLDEIGSASLQIQASLLRAIQSGEVRRVGTTTPIKVDVRLICSTSGDLEALMNEGRFRKDLYYRINVVTLRIQPLRERREDIALLASEFVNRSASRHQRSIIGISPQALAVLENHDWPGNVRELESAIEHAVLFSPPEAQTISVDSLPSSVRCSMFGQVEPEQRDQERSLDELLDKFERHIVINALAESNWNQSEAARKLEVPEKRIRDRVRKYGLRAPETGPAQGNGTMTQMPSSSDRPI